MAADDAAVRAQEVTQQPMVSRSGVDLTSMDQAANPCNDFYQYACGGWIENHPAPPDQPRYGRFDELQDRNNGILRDILEQAAKPGAPADQKKIGDYYASCMDESGIDAKGRAPLGPDLQRVDGIKDKNEIPAVVGHLQTVGTTDLLRLRRGAGLQGRDAVHPDLRPGRPRPAGSRLLPERRRRRRRSCAANTRSTSPG